MAYATQVGQNIFRKFNRNMAYLVALKMVTTTYSSVTILDDEDRVECRLIKNSHGGIKVWTPVKCDSGHGNTCKCYHTKISKFVGTIVPKLEAMTALT